VPTEAGALWAGVGKTAMEAANQLMSSPINPLVREQMKEGVQRAQLGEAAMKHAAANKNWLYGTVAETPQGATMVAPITQPVTQQAAQNIDTTGDGSDNKTVTKPNPTITRTGKNTGVDENGQPYYEAKPGSNQWTSGTPPQPPPKDPSAGMAQGGLVRGYDAGGTVSSESKSDAAPLNQMALERQAAGLGTRMFLNPSTGNYEPTQAQEPPPQVNPPQQGGSIWSPARRPTPLAPPAPDNQAPQQAQAAPPPPEASALAHWQDQNVHPVIAPKAVLDAFRTNVSTAAQDATYLSGGGIKGEPAWVINLKGGGSTTISASQLAATPWGRALMTNHNASEVLEQQSNAQQPQGNGQQPPSSQQGPVWSPFGNQVPFPASAPAPPVPQQPNPAQRYPTIAQDQTGPPAAPGAYNPAPYQMPQGPTVSQTGAVNPALMAGGSNQQAVEGAKAAADAQKENASAETLNADANSAHPIFNWQTDEKGKVYTSLPEDAAHPFLERRFYKGSSGFVPGQGSPEDLRKQQLLEEYAGPGGPPIPDGITMNYDTIKNSSPEWQDLWLRHARFYKLHPNAPDPTGPQAIGLQNAANSIKDAQQIEDKILWLKENKIPLSTISQDEMVRSKEAAWAQAAYQPGMPSWAQSWGHDFWDFLAKKGPVNKFADSLAQDMVNLNTHLGKTPGGTYEGIAATPKQEELGGTIPFTNIDLSVPRGTNVSTINPLNKITQGGNDYDTALAGIREVKNNAIADYKRYNDELTKGGSRIPETDLKNLSNLTDSTKGYIEDENNRMRDKNRNLVNNIGIPPQRKWDAPWSPTHGWDASSDGSTSAKVSLSPTPVSKEISDAAPRPKTDADYKAIKSGTLFWDGDGKLKTKP
jgi:hypothetical protein